MYLHVCVSMLSVSACIACIGPLGHGNHHSIPKTPSRDPAPRPTQGTPGHVPDHFLTPSQPPPRPDFSIFSWRTGIWTCLATAIESARMLLTGQNFAHLPSHQHSTGHDCVSWNQIFIYGWRVHKKTPPLQQFCVLVHLATVIESARIVQAGSNLSSHPHCGRRTLVRWNQTHILGVLVLPSWPLDQFLLCRHIVANALHKPQTSTICWERAVIKSVLWLWSNGLLVAEIWPWRPYGV